MTDDAAPIPAYEPSVDVVMLKDILAVLRHAIRVVSSDYSDEHPDLVAAGNLFEALSRLADALAAPDDVSTAQLLRGAASSTQMAIADLNQARSQLITADQAAAEHLIDRRNEETGAVDAVISAAEVTVRLPSGSPATIRIGYDEDGRLQWTADTLLPLAAPDARAHLDVHTVFRLLGEAVAWHLHPMDKG